MDSTSLDIDTGDSFAAVDLTRRIGEWVRDRGDGLLHVFAPHATAGFALIETGSGSEQDLQTVVERLLPRDDELWTHRHGRAGHGGDHVLPALISPSLTLPVLDGQVALGTWQSVVFVDPNRDNSARTVRLSFLQG